MSQSNKRSTWIVLSLLTVLLGSSFVYVTADPPGYCAAQQRYIPDEEFIQASATLFEWDMNRTIVYQDGRKKKRKDVHYENVSKKLDFDSKSPNCCLIERENTNPIYTRLLGWQEVSVRLNPETSTRPIQFPTDNIIRLTYNVCGKLLNYDFTYYPYEGHKEITTTNIFTITNPK